MAFSVTGCVSLDKVPDDSAEVLPLETDWFPEPDSGITDTGWENPDTCEEIKVLAAEIQEIAGECVAVFQRPWCEYSKVYGVRISGSDIAPGETPPAGSVYLSLPGACGSSGLQGVDAVDIGDEWEVNCADTMDCPGVPNDTYGVECNSGDQAEGDWTLTLPMHSNNDCSDYGDLMLEFYTEDDPECQGVAGAAGADSPTPNCQHDQDATFRLGFRRWADLDEDGTLHGRLVPILESGSDYVERAWIRSIEVTDWGDATELHVLRHGQTLTLSGDTVSSTGVETFVPTAASQTFAVGEIAMGTAFVVDDIPAGTNYTPPKITMSWSCQVDTMNPHFNVLTVPQAYTRRLRQLGFATMTQDQRVILRIDSAQSHATVELQGRYHDALTVPLTASGSNWLFDFEDEDFGVKAVGSIEPDVNGKELVFTELVVGQLNIGAQSWVFGELDESGL